MGANLELTHEWMRGLPPTPGDKVRAEIEEALQDAREGVERIAAIVRDMKALSRSDEEHVGPVDIEGVLEGSIAIARNEIHHRAQAVRHFAQLPPVQGNAPRLGQVFLNLIVNAAHAIEAGNAAGNEIRVTTSLTEHGAVRVDIEDTGQGIPEELRRAYSSRSYHHPSARSPASGSSICHGMLQSLGGTLECSSEVCKGSTFSVTLPASVMVASRPEPRRGPRVPARAVFSSSTTRPRWPRRCAARWPTITRCASRPAARLRCSSWRATPPSTSSCAT